MAPAEAATAVTLLATAPPSDSVFPAAFTMSIFITLLAFNNPEIIDISTLSILITSALAGTIGYLFKGEEGTGAWKVTTRTTT